MVGFVREVAKEEEGGVANQLKGKDLDDLETYRLDSRGFSTDLDCFSIPTLEPFIEFDSIKDWIEEMQFPDSVERSKPEISCLVEATHLETPIGNLTGQDMDNQIEHVMEERGETVGVVESDRVESSSIVDVIVGIGETEGINKSDAVDCNLGEAEYHEGEMKSADTVVNKCGPGILDINDCEKIASLSSSIEESLGKVTLAGDGGCLVVGESDVKGSGIVRGDTESESKTESEDSASSSSDTSDTSSDSSESDDEEEVVKKDSIKKKIENTEQKIEVEEGEIMDADADKMVSWTDDDDDDDDEGEDDNGDRSLEDFELDDEIGDDEDECLPKGPIRSKNEIKDLPPVPPVNVSLQPSQQILPVGVISSVLGTQVIVEGSEKHNPLSEGSILWVVQSRLALGLVDEIFGPVKTPYYIVRYNSEGDIPSGIENGTAVGFVPEFVDHVLNDKSLYQKGYDASGENDEEVFDETEFSDDEKEAEYRRMLKVSKRGNNNEGQGAGKRMNRKHDKNRENTWTRNQSSATQSRTVQPPQPTRMQLNQRAPSPSFNQGAQPGTSSAGPVFTGAPSLQSSVQGNLSGFSPHMTGPGFSGGPAGFPQMPQPTGPLSNGTWPNGMISQQQNMAMSGGVQMNCMPWLQQNQLQPLQMSSTAPPLWQQQQHFPQFPLGNPGPSQQPFDLSQLVTGNNGSPFGPMNFATGATNSPWPGLMVPNLSMQAPFFAGVQNPNAQLPMLSGFMPNGPQQAGPAGLSSNSQSGTTGFPRNEEVSQFNQGASSGKGRGRQSFRGRGGRFRGGRGRHQSN